MANQVTLDPMVLDTAAYPLVTGRTVNIIKSVEWINPVELEDEVYLLDADGTIICHFICTTPNEGKSTFFGDKGRVFTGPFNLSKLDSGKLLVGRV